MLKPMNLADFESFWPTFSRVIHAQQTYALDPQLTLHEAFSLWCEQSLHAFAYIEDGTVLGSYYIKPNAMGQASIYVIAVIWCHMKPEVKELLV